MSQVKVHAYATPHTYTHVATGMLRGLRQIIVAAGLSPSRLASDWTVLENGIGTWLNSHHLQRLTLEVWHPADPDGLIQRFDFTIDYGYYSNGDGELWLDPKVVRQAIAKAGAMASNCDYTIKIRNADGAPPVLGFASCTYRSTNGMREYSVGTVVGGGSLGASLSYWAARR
jgi:hypothetical protein